MRRLVSAMLVVAGIIHLLPVPGLLGANRLAALYGLSFDDPNLAILMRHRAVLFGLLGSFMLLAAFRPALQALGLLAGSVSAASFVLLAWSVGGYNAPISRVVAADIVALGCLLVGTGAYVRARSADPSTRTMRRSGPGSC